MPLNPSDLENWLADPEEWLNLEDKENDQWEFEIRVGKLLDIIHRTIDDSFRVALQRTCSYAIDQSLQ